MTEISKTDLIIVGAGPAGMAAARRAVDGGLNVVVLDQQSLPGGQIWRSVTRNAESPIIEVLGAEYRRGIGQARAFLASKATYIPDAQVSRVDQGWSVEYVKNDQIETINARFLLLATGAQERPMPFSGWTTPGVMTVGAAQILLKTAGQLPQGPVVVAGNGPLPLLYLQQMRMAGTKAIAYLDTTPPGLLGRALGGLGGALRDPAQILKGLAWLPQFNGIPHIKNVKAMRALGSNRLEAVSVETQRGEVLQFEAKSLLVHEGLVPHHHLAVSAGARLVWDGEQLAFRLERDSWMCAGPDGLFIAGDTVRIGGAVNAEIEGEIAAVGILLQAGKLTEPAAIEGVAALRKMHGKQRAFRAFLDSVYVPNLSRARQQDDTILCRCEELSAGELRHATAQGGCKGPNQLKVFTRAGMGPCQGRQCGYPVHELVKAAVGLPADEVGLYHPRPPFVPITLSMVAAQDAPPVQAASTQE